jgi:hypothetical protein
MVPRPQKMDTKRIINRFMANLTYRQFVVSASHSNYLFAIGGTEKMLHEEQAAFQLENISYVQIYPLNGSPESNIEKGREQCVGVNVDSIETMICTLGQLNILFQLMSTMEGFYPIAFHLHHLMGFSLEGLLHLLKTYSGTPMRLFIHDYYTVCPQINLLYNGKVFCDSPPVSSGKCHSCRWGEARVAFLPIIRKFLKEINATFISPSDTASDIWIQSFPEYKEKVRIIPHQKAVKQNKTTNYDKRKAGGANRIRVAYLGYESVNKGYDIWSNLVLKNRLGHYYQLFHIGHADRKLPGVVNVPFSFLTLGSDAMIDIIKLFKIDIAFLWSLCPETYSFTFFEALASGCFVLTNNMSGNIAKQVEIYRSGIIFDDEAQLVKYLTNEEKVKESLSRHLARSHRYRFFRNTRLIKETVKKKNVNASLDEKTERQKNDEKLIGDLFQRFALETMEPASLTKMSVRGKKNNDKPLKTIRHYSEAINRHIHNGIHRNRFGKILYYGRKGIAKGHLIVRYFNSRIIAYFKGRFSQRP